MWGRRNLLPWKVNGVTARLARKLGRVGTRGQPETFEGAPPFDAFT